MTKQEKYPKVRDAITQQIAWYINENTELAIIDLGYSMVDVTQRQLKAHVRLEIGPNPEDIHPVSYYPSQFSYGWRRLKPLRNSLTHHLQKKGIKKFEAVE